jgi:hypothetical protein
MAKSALKTGTVSALEYLVAPDKYPAQGICAVFGDEAYLKSEVLSTLRRQVLACDGRKIRAQNKGTGVNLLAPGGAN